MARIFNITCLVAGMFVFTNANEYCKIQCKNLFDGSIDKHTMCTYPSPNPGPACHKPHSIGLSTNEKTAIVQKHNELRRRVASGKETRGRPGPQPPAVDMPDLIWDIELETIAQRWANQCIWDHDKCNDVKRFRVGQNIAYTNLPGENNTTPVEYFVQLWYDEVDDFDSKLVPNFQLSDKIVTHYTQVVWAETKNIGCGRIKYTVSDSLNRHFLVCNYGPRGNLLGAPVYKIKK